MNRDPQSPRPVDPTPFELDIEAMANGGSGMGFHQNRAVFVPYTIPGERVEARVVQDKGRFARAEGVRLIDASADRVFPVCPHFGPGKCYRCQWQHIDYKAQLLLKQDVLADQLARIARLDDAPIEPVIPSNQQWGYNFHMTLVALPDGKLGFYGQDDRHIEPILECHILHPDLLALYNQFDLDIEGLRRAKLQLGTDGAHMVILSMQDDNAPELETDVATSVNLLLSDNEPMNLIGESHTRYRVNGREFRVTAGSYFRPHVGQLGTLAQVVMQMLNLKGGENLLDLYAGVGFFSAFAAAKAGLITLVESYPPAVSDADENLADIEHIDVIEGSVDEVLENLEEEHQVAIVDPPVEGLGEHTAELLAEAGVKRLVHVSSDAASLAHDVQRLARHGYRLKVAQPIDLAPQTYYVDTVSLFERE